MSKGRLLARDILELYVHYSLLYGVVALLGNYVINMPKTDLIIAWMSVVLWFVFVLYYFARRLIKNPVVFIMSHLFLPLLVFIAVPVTSLRVFLFIFFALTGMYSIWRRGGRFSAEGMFYFLPYFFAGFLSGMYFLSLNQNYKYMSFVYPVLIVSSLIAGELYNHIKSLDQTLEAICITTIQPVKKILAFDRVIIIIFIASMLILTFCLKFALIDPGLKAVDKIRFPVRESSVEEQDSESVWERPHESEPNDGEYIKYNAEPYSFWAFLQRIIIFLGPVIYIVLFLIVLIPVMRFVYRLLGRMPKRISLSNEEKQFIFTESANKKRRRLFGLTGENKTRRQFRKTIRRHIKNGVPIIESDTPSQMVEKITNEDISELVEEYIKVRYKM